MDDSKSCHAFQVPASGWSLLSLGGHDTVLLLTCTCSWEGKTGTHTVGSVATKEATTDT